MECAESAAMSIKLSTRTSPEVLATLLKILRESSKVASLEATSLSKVDLSHKTGSALIFVKFNELETGEDIEIKLWQPRSGKTSSKTNRDTAGYVYLVKNVHAQEYKIGKTTNPKSRKRTFDLKLPFRVELLHTIYTDDMHSWRKRCTSGSLRSGCAARSSSR
jgi:hypothetical protein